MARADALSILYSKTRTPLEFNFDSLMMAPMANYVTMQDINSLYNVASSVRYASKVEAKYKVIDEIMRNRGFKKYASGTNRVVVGNTFTVNVKVSVSKMFLGWIMGLGDKAKIVGPQSVVDQMKQEIERMYDQYKKKRRRYVSYFYKLYTGCRKKLHDDRKGNGRKSEREKSSCGIFT